MRKQEPSGSGGGKFRSGHFLRVGFASCTTCIAMPGNEFHGEELYYRGYREYPVIPRVPEDQGYEERKNWESTMFTRLSELRKAVEPDPEDPLYIETLRGEGIIFHLYW